MRRLFRDMISRIIRLLIDMISRIKRLLIGRTEPNDQAVTQLGLLDIPSELRVMIFRHLLVYPHGMDVGLFATEPRPSLHILITSRLIHREASGVLYRENLFLNFLGAMHYYLDPRFRTDITIPAMAEMIQNVCVQVRLGYIFLAVHNFLQFMPHLGNEDPSNVRGTLIVRFNLDGTGRRWFVPLRWFIRALGRFTNFRTIELEVFNVFFTDLDDPDYTFDVVEYIKLTLEPVFGIAEDLSRERNGLLRFHPFNHRNRLTESENGDWADYLDGIRLDEAETKTDDSETPGQDQEGEEA